MITINTPLGKQCHCLHVSLQSTRTWIPQSSLINYNSFQGPFQWKMTIIFRNHSVLLTKKNPPSIFLFPKRAKKRNKLGKLRHIQQNFGEPEKFTFNFQLQCTQRFFIFSGKKIWNYYPTILCRYCCWFMVIDWEYWSFMLK